MNNFLLLPNEEKEAKLYEISDSVRVNHVNKILKMVKGDKLKVFIPNHGIGLAKIISITELHLVVELISLDTSEGPEQSYRLVVGASRPQTCKKLLEHATSMGVKSFDFFKAKLSEKSYLSSKIYETGQRETLLLNGLSQSGVYYKMPEVEVQMFCNVSKFSRYDQKYVLSLDTDKTFDDYEIDFSKNITLAIGPERGWTYDEILSLTDNGFKEVKISSSILRVEVATFASLGQLEALKLKNNNL